MAAFFGQFSSPLTIIRNETYFAGLLVQLPLSLCGIRCLVVVHGWTVFLLGPAHYTVFWCQTKGLFDDVHTSCGDYWPHEFFLDVQFLQNWDFGTDGPRCLWHFSRVCQTVQIRWCHKGVNIWMTKFSIHYQKASQYRLQQNSSNGILFLICRSVSFFSIFNKTLWSLYRFTG